MLPRGHGLIFTTSYRPVRTARGWSPAPVRHGVSTVRFGRRHALGLVFHDALVEASGPLADGVCGPVQGEAVDRDGGASP